MTLVALLAACTSESDSVDLDDGEAQGGGDVGLPEGCGDGDEDPRAGRGPRHHVAGCGQIVHNIGLNCASPVGVEE